MELLIIVDLKPFGSFDSSEVAPQDLAVLHYIQSKLCYIVPSHARVHTEYFKIWLTKSPTYHPSYLGIWAIVTHML